MSGGAVMDSVSHLISAAMEFGSALMAVMNEIAVSFWLYIHVQTIKLARSYNPNSSIHPPAAVHSRSSCTNEYCECSFECADAYSTNLQWLCIMILMYSSNAGGHFMHTTNKGLSRSICSWYRRML